MSVLVIPEFENDNEQLLDNADVAAQPFSDDRANVPVSETTERFLRAVISKVPLDRIEELHLFSPLRQGTAETGIAVIAARVIVPDEPESEVLEQQLEAAPDVEVDEPEVETFAAEDAAIDEAPVDEPAIDTDAAIEVEGVDGELVGGESAPGELLETASIEGEAIAGNAIDDEATADEGIADEGIADEGITDEGIADETIEGEEIASAVADNDSPYADEPLPVAAEEMLELAHQLAPEVADELPSEPPAARVRHTVYTARYRLVIKGPERGRWEMDVVDEADAPLLAIESVVRGVQRRAGEETGTIRYDAAQLARALRMNPTS